MRIHKLAIVALIAAVPTAAAFAQSAPVRAPRESDDRATRESDDNVADRHQWEYGDTTNAEL